MTDTTDGKVGTGELSDHDIAGLIQHEISAAVTYDKDELAARRSRSIEYLRGEMNDTPSRPNGSTVTSRDLADTISWMLPGIMRVFMASDRMAEYEPLAPDLPDPALLKQAEENAEQASDYVSYVFMKDNEGYRTVYNATYDGLLTGNGVVKHWWDDTPETKISHHSRMTVEQAAQLQQDDGVKILAAEKNPQPDMVMDPETGQPTPVDTWNIKVERTTSRGRLRVECIAPENFLMDSDAVTIDDARFCAHRDPNMTRSKLIEMGFDKEKVDALTADQGARGDSDEAAARRRGSWGGNNLIRSMEHIDYHECYLKVDVDGDGIAETCKIHYAGAGGAGEVLDWEVWEDDDVFSDIPCYPQPHRYDAESVSDRTIDIQQIKTVLQRQALDNLYASNLPMREVEENTVLNPDILVSPKFGGVIWKKRGSLPIVPHVIPFVADKVFLATEYFDRVIEKRTGVSRTMMALDPEALQNQTATANQNARDASYSQNELVARNMAELGWRRVFRALLHLIVKHQDRPRTIRLRGKFVEMDPRSWNADMDVTVNIGLGTGSRDRDMAMLQSVLMSQLAITDRFAGAGFHEEAVEMIPRIRQTLIKSAESAGIRNPDQFYPEIDDQRLQAMKQKADEQAQQPPMEIQLEQAKQKGAQELKALDVQAQQQIEGAKGQAQGQLEQMKAQIQAQTTTQIEGVKAEGNKVKEAAQLQADLIKSDADRQLQREQIESNERIKAAEIASQERMKAAEIASREKVAMQQAAVQREQAAEDRMVQREGLATKAASDSEKLKAQAKKPNGGAKA